MARAVLLALLLLLGGPAQAAWVGQQNGAERSGVAAGPGPEWADVAFTVTVGIPTEYPERSFKPDPVIIDGQVYLAVTVEPFESSRLVRLDLQTGALTELGMLPPRTDRLASDGRHLLVTNHEGATLLDLDGKPLWGWPFPSDGEETMTIWGNCNAVASDGLWFLLCSAAHGGPILPPPVYSPLTLAPFSSYLAALSPDGQPLWGRRLEMPTASGQPTAPAGGGTATYLFGTTLSVIGGQVFVSGDELTSVAVAAAVMQNQGQEIPGRPMPNRQFIQAYDSESGAILWSKSSDFSHVYEPDPTLSDALPTQGISQVVGGPSIVFAKLGQLVHSFNARQGTELWASDVRQADVIEDYGRVSIAFEGDSLFVPTVQSLTRVDALTGATQWQYALPPEAGLLWSIDTTVVAGDQVLATAEGPQPSLVSLDAKTGRLRWMHETFGTLAVDGDLGVLVDDMGNVTVLGHTAASPTASAKVDELVPKPGRTVHVDLSGSKAGSQGPATSYRADWGDGTASGWQASPRFSHSYSTAALTEARFFVRNDAGQSDSQAVAFDVGGTKLNAIQRAFAPENQNLTFFLIGLAVTILGGLWGFIRLRAKMGLLQREMQAIHAAFDRTRANVLECEAALHARRLHVERLLEDGKLDEAKFQLVEKRIEKLLRELRTGLLDARFDYLPRGLARKLEGLLADGHVNPWEREAFDAILRADTLLTREQKAQVRALVASWAERDTSRTAGSPA